MKTEMNQPLANTLSKKRAKASPPFPAALLLEPKSNLHPHAKPTVDPRWVTHTPIRKEP